MGEKTTTTATMVGARKRIPPSAKAKGRENLFGRRVSASPSPLTASHFPLSNRVGKGADLVDVRFFAAAKEALRGELSFILAAEKKIVREKWNMELT